MGIEYVQIENFTVFQMITTNFTKGINVLIGENGTGKTHLMKLMYGVLNESEANSINKYFKIQNNVNLSTDKNLNVRINVKLQNIEDGLLLTFLNGEWGKPDEEGTRTIPEYVGCVIQRPNEGINNTFIPAKDMLTHSKSFLSMYDKYDMPFDKTYYDIISKSLLPNLKEVPAIGKAILPQLEMMIGGKVVVENDTFYIEKIDGTKVEFSVEAEGIKKIAILWQLIMNESITEGSVLFWDEPEANINPALYKDVANILLELSRNGVQIFLATHNYNFVKYIEVLSEESDQVGYHSLYKTENGVKCETEMKFSLLSNNALREDNINLYDAEMKKEFEE